MQQTWIWPELLGAAVKLAQPANDDAHAAMRGPDDSSDNHILVAIPAQVADLLAIGSQAHEREPAVVVLDVGWADI